MSTPNLKKRLLALAAATLAVVVGAQDALAIIGRPLTPVSFAGVARRTTRRAVYGVGAGMAVGSVAVGAAAATATTAAYLTTLPSSCVRSAYYGSVRYDCGGTYYRPIYDGPNLVYAPE